MALDVIAYAMSGTGPYTSTTINNGGVLVGSPPGSGFLAQRIATASNPALLTTRGLLGRKPPFHKALEHFKVLLPRVGLGCRPFEMLE